MGRARLVDVVHHDGLQLVQVATHAPNGVRPWVGGPVAHLARQHRPKGAVQRVRADRPCLAAVAARKLALDVVQEGKGQAPAGGLARHAHVRQAAADQAVERVLPGHVAGAPILLLPLRQFGQQVERHQAGVATRGGGLCQDGGAARHQRQHQRCAAAGRRPRRRHGCGL